MIGYIYAIKSRQYIKVGKAICLGSRFADLQVANPEKLTLRDAWIVHRGSMSDAEGAAHEALAQMRVRGEWFRDHGKIIDERINYAVSPYSLAPHRLSAIEDDAEVLRHVSVIPLTSRRLKMGLSR